MAVSFFCSVKASNTVGTDLAKLELENNNNSTSDFQLVYYCIIMNRHQVLKILLLLHCYSSARLPSSRLHLLSKGLSVGKPLLQQQKKRAGVDRIQLEVWFEIYVFKIYLI